MMMMMTVFGYGKFKVFCHVSVACLSFNI